MPMYDFIECSDDNAEKWGSLQEYYRDESDDKSRFTLRKYCMFCKRRNNCTIEILKLFLENSWRDFNQLWH